MADLEYVSASEALRLFRAREISPVELMESLIARTEAVEPAINAFTETRFDEALEQARAAEAAYSGKASSEPRPLEGIPLAMKEETAVKGWSAQWGSLAYKDNVSEETAAVAQRIFDSGAIVHARTTTPEFSIADFTHTRLWGVTRNPWNPEWAVGGSSGGAAAALAAGTTMLANGSDIGGSIRTPAAFCGVVGYKPPYGRVPEEPPYNLDAYIHEGPMARTVADAAIFANAISGRHPRDHVSLPKVEVPVEGTGDASGLRVMLSVHQGDRSVDPDVEREIRAAAGALGQAGAEVEEVDLPWKSEELDRAAMIHWAAIWGVTMQGDLAKYRDLLCDYTIDFLERCDEILDRQSFAEGLAIEGRAWEPLGALFERFDLLVTPTIATRGLVAGESYVNTSIEVGGEEVAAGEWRYLMVHPFNMFSRCPVLVVPAGMVDNGIPTGAQLVGRPYEDETVFRAGYALERVRPWADRRPAIG